MKRSELKRKAPMARGTGTLNPSRAIQAKNPMAHGQARMRHCKPKADKPKRAARENEDRDLMNLCHGQACYLQVPGIFRHDPDTVVPCHSNQQKHGKGERIKAHNRFTVPGCHACHAEIDQGMRFTKAEKFAIWDRAFDQWEVDRTDYLLASAK